jgi:3-hydroxyisobutyrate dehydrogenase-like beta-hydroxyacid dehydrogenase
MGTALAGRLIAAGYQVEGVDPAPRKRSPCPVHASIEDAVADGRPSFQAAIASLPSPVELLDSITRLLALPPEQVPRYFVNLSTIGSEAAEHAAARFARPGLRTYVEAPVTGGVLRAAEGRAAILLGSTDDVGQELLALLDRLARRVLHVGSVTDASKVKLINNFIAIANTFVAVEGLRLAARLGLDPLETRRLLEDGTADSYVLRSTVQRPMTTGDLSTGFALRLALKDMLLLREALGAERAELLAAVIEILATGAGRGQGDYVFPLAALGSIPGQVSAWACAGRAVSTQNG